MIRRFGALLGLAWAITAGPAAAQEAAPAEADPSVRRARVLSLQCRSCHSFKAGEAHKIGPNLNGIIGAASASRAGFQGYSDGLKAAKLKWDDATLDAYLTAPSKLVPGNKMAFAGIPKAEDRAALIAWLKTNS
jgi:cytochrome c